MKVSSPQNLSFHIEYFTQALSGSFVECLEIEMEESLASDSSQALRCVLEQDTLSSALYWFNFGRQENVLI